MKILVAVIIVILVIAFFPILGPIAVLLGILGAVLWAAVWWANAARAVAETASESLAEPKGRQAAIGFVIAGISIAVVGAIIYGSAQDARIMKVMDELQGTYAGSAQFPFGKVETKLVVEGKTITDTTVWPDHTETIVWRVKRVDTNADELECSVIEGEGASSTSYSFGGAGTPDAWLRPYMWNPGSACSLSQ